MQTDLGILFGEQLVKYINDQAIAMAKVYQADIQDTILTPFIRAEKEVAEAPEDRTQEEQNELLKTIFSLMEPAKIVQNIEKAVSSSKVSKQYNAFVKNIMNKTPFKEIFQQATFNSKMVSDIQQTALVNMQYVIDALQIYIKTLNNHHQIVRKVANGKAGKSILKAAASVVGMGVGIPFLGMGVGALLGSGDRQKINASLENVLNTIDFMQEEITNTIVDLLDSLHLMFLTLLGGTFLAANELFKKHHSYIKDIDLKDDLLIVELENEERLLYEKWLKTTTDGIEQLVKQQKWIDAISLSQKFYKMVIDNPIHARVLLNDKQTGLYVAHSYYYAVYQEALLQDYRNGHVESFVKKGEQLLRSLIAIPAESFLPTFASSPKYFVLLMLKHYYSDAFINQRSLFAELKENSRKRFENKDVTNEEKRLSPSDVAVFEIMELFNYYVQTKKIPDSMIVSIPRSFVLELIQLDATLNHNDLVTVFLQKSKWKRLRIGHIAKILIKSASIVALLMLIGYFSIHSVVPYVQKIATSEKTEEKVKIVKKVAVKEPIANIRNQPNYDHSKVIGSIEKGQQFKLLKGPIKDKGGANVKWYKINYKGKSVYVSSKLVKLKIEKKSN